MRAQRTPSLRSTGRSGSAPSPHRWRHRSWLGLLALALASPALAQRFVAWNPDGSRAGTLVIRSEAGGDTVADFDYKSNGRGPTTQERYRLAGDGTPLAYRVTGTSTFGSTIDESYQRDAGQLRWRSPVDGGERAAPGAALYAAMGGSPAVDAIAVAALAAAPARSLPLVPSGTLRQQVTDRLVVNQGGRPQALQLVVHTGQGFEPSYLWATDDAAPAGPRLFALIWPGWYSLVEEGWEAVLAQLEARQKAAAEMLLRQRAADWLQPLPGLPVVRNARVFDSEAARLGAASDVYVFRGRISAVLPTGTASPAAPDTEIDAAGRVMLPGLFDMHDHAWPGNGGLHLAAGVTTTRDLSNDNRTLQQTIDQIEAGQLAYPQVVAAGFIEGDSPLALRNGIVIKTLAEARTAVDWYAQRGYPQIKIYNSFPREILRETVAYAHQRGLRVSGHVPVFLRAEDVIEMGFDEIQPVNQLLLNFLVTPTTDTRTLERFYLPAERLGSLDLDSAPVQDFIALLKRRDVVVDLTLMTFQFLQQRDGEVPAEFAGVMGHLPLDVQRGALLAQMKIPDDATAARYRAAVAKMTEFAGRLYRAGVTLVAGTDRFPGIVLHSELIGYVQAGLTPAQALQVATRNGARVTGTAADRGAITPGRRADLILVDGEPTVNITDIRRVAGVITQGR